MSQAAVEAVNAKEKSQNANWSRLLRQIFAIMKLEVKKNFWGVRSILVYLLALTPIVITGGIAAVVIFFSTVGGDAAALRDDFVQSSGQILSGIYNGLILRMVIFFGCTWIFMNLFRGEVVDRSLHYYFLCPVRREVLIVGKYLSGLTASVIIFSLATLVSIFFIYLAGYPSSINYLLQGPGMRHIGLYLVITILACIGYGAFFLLIGLFFKNPIIPAIALFAWESINYLLPPLLKKISVIHYLVSLDPSPMDNGPFAVLVEPTPAWIGIPSLLIVTILVLAVACWRARRMEISYGSE